MKQIIILLTILCMVSCASNKGLTHLDTLSKSKREKYLVAKAKEMVLLLGPDYYREYKKPEIERGQYPDDSREYAGRIYYNVKLPYDSLKERLSEKFAAGTSIWADTGKPFYVGFGNGIRYDLSKFSQENYREVRVPYQQASVHPIFDWQNGKDYTNSDPVNKDELIKRGYEKQADGKWRKVRPDVPPKY